MASLAREAKASDYFVVINELLPKVPSPFSAQVAQNAVWSALHSSKRGLLIASSSENGTPEAFALVEEINKPTGSECFIIMVYSPGGATSKLLKWAVEQWAKRRNLSVLSCAYTGEHMEGLALNGDSKKGRFTVSGISHSGRSAEHGKFFQGTRIKA